MSAGECTAFYYSNRLPIRLRWEQGRIASWRLAYPNETPRRWFAPLLVDHQVNGFAGVDFQSDTLDVPQLEEAARGLLRAGCGAWCLTLVTDDWEQMLHRLRNAVELRRRSALLQKVIIGWHLEGPFLSTVAGYRGAHPADKMISPTPAHIQALRHVAPRDPILLTVSPEVPGVIEAIAEARRWGIRVSLGHTNASAGQLKAAREAGAFGFTHLGNACPQDLDRHDNILWRVLETDLKVSLIPDGIHVSPSLFRLIHRLLHSSNIFYVSDAMSAAGAPPGRYRLGASEVEVGPDRIVRKPGERNFAGSALAPIEGIFRAASMLGGSWQQAWRHYSKIPAGLLGVSELPRIGLSADFCLLEISESNQLQSLEVYLEGERV